MALTVRSLGWAPGERIPTQYTADGEDRSPKVEFGGVAKDVQSFALVFDDPDAPGGTWVHWVLYNIPGTARGLPEHLPRSEDLPDGMRQGRNSWDEIGYRGPSPPPGKPHRYIFHLYALSQAVRVPPGATSSALQELIRPHVLATATYTGTYGRERTGSR